MPDEPTPPPGPVLWPTYAELLKENAELRAKANEGRLPWLYDRNFLANLATIAALLIAVWRGDAKVEEVKEQQVDNVKRLERVEDDSAAVRSIIVGDK